MNEERLLNKQVKRIQRLTTIPANLSWDELRAILNGFGYEQTSAGTTGGSRVKFRGDGLPDLNLHRPHNPEIVRRYVLRQIVKALKREGVL